MDSVDTMALGGLPLKALEDFGISAEVLVELGIAVGLFTVVLAGVLIFFGLPAADEELKESPPTTEKSPVPEKPAGEEKTPAAPVVVDDSRATEKAAVLTTAEKEPEAGGAPPPVVVEKELPVVPAEPPTAAAAAPDDVAEEDEAEEKSTDVAPVLAKGDSQPKGSWDPAAEDVPEIPEHLEDLVPDVDVAEVAAAAASAVEQPVVEPVVEQVVQDAAAVLQEEPSSKKRALSESPEEEEPPQPVTEEIPASERPTEVVPASERPTEVVAPPPRKPELFATSMDGSIGLRDTMEDAYDVLASSPEFTAGAVCDGSRGTKAAEAVLKVLKEYYGRKRSTAEQGLKEVLAKAEQTCLSLACCSTVSHSNSVGTFTSFFLHSFLSSRVSL